MSGPLVPGQPNTDSPQMFRWSLRARWLEGEQASVYTRNLSFNVEQQASFKENATHPSAVEYLLGALASDLLTGFATQATRQGVELDALEARVSGYLSNPLVYLGVVGDEGHPGFEEIECQLYITAEADEATLQQIWQTVQRRAPVLNTLRRGVGSLKLGLKVIL